MKIYIQTLGCPKNDVDSENLAGLLADEGWEIVSDPYQADILLVNTCGFIKDAKTESIDGIFELAQLKGDSKKLVVTGCLSQRYSQELFSEIPEVDGLFGVNDYHVIPYILKGLTGEDEFPDIPGLVIEEKGKKETGGISGKRVMLVSEAPERYCEIPLRKRMGPAFTSYLRISEGCCNICTYCIIPFIRGGFRSRTMEAIVKEAEMLAAEGTKELVLVAQDTTAYGIDIYGKYMLPQLLEKLCGIREIRWIRLMYCYEDSLTDELIKTIAENEKICNYIDLPLQHVSDRILAAMNRRSTSASIRNTIKRLRQQVPDIHLRTTFITGFPGETEEDFEELADFVEEVGFERMGAFAYSEEEGTEAAEMENQVDEDLRQQRQEQLMVIQQSISNEKNSELVGRDMLVLVEGGPDEDGAYLGRTEYDAPEIDNGVILYSDRQLEPGMFVMAHIEDAFDYDITARVIE